MKMSRRSEANLRGIPMKPYDLLREGLIIFGLVAIIVVILAIIYSSPDYPTVRGQDVAQRQPLAYLRTSANILAGNSGIDGYGPPYTADPANAQQVLGIAPANWFGVTIPINPAQDFILKPLARVALLNKDVAGALRTYQAATTDQQQAWVKAYLAALDQATVTNKQVQIPGGDYRPVGILMDGMLNLGRAGLLEGALASNTWLPFTFDYTHGLLFFQDDVDASVADSLDMTGELWGVSHETGPYPGAWWLWPYTFFYQVPPFSTSDNADLQVSLIIGLLFLVTMFAPYIPVINRLPRWLGVYKLIWRDWYQHPRPQTTNLNRPMESR
jgi:hypothetical protein